MKRIDLPMPTAVIAMMCLPVLCAAQSADELPPALLACAEETDVARRLECFDREMAELGTAPEAPPAPVTEAAPEPEPIEPAPEPATAPSEKPAAEPAPLVPAEAPQRELPAQPAAPVSAPAAAPQPATASAENFGLPDAGPNEIVARVTNIMKRPYGEMVVLLDNGQIWEQKHRDNRFRLDIGDEVTISEGMISGYRLTGGGRNNSIQVERLK